MPKVNVSIFDDNNCDLPVNAEEFINFFQSRLSTIPEEHRDSAKISLNASDWDLEVEISYTREQTEEEISVCERQKEKQKDLMKIVKLSKIRELEKELDDLYK